MIQEREYNAFKYDNVLVEEKNELTATLLGIFPGSGSFYAREPGLVFVNLLAWPFSIIWDPTSGLNGAKAINYDITKQKLHHDKAKDIML